MRNANAYPESDTRLSRRGFMAAASLTAAVAFISPRRLLAADDGIVGAIKTAAGTNPITVQPLRGNISVLLGSGGNIAVLPGPDGKLLIDAGIAVS